MGYGNQCSLRPLCLIRIHIHSCSCGRLGIQGQVLIHRKYLWPVSLQAASGSMSEAAGEWRFPDSAGAGTEIKVCERRGY